MSEIDYGRLDALEAALGGRAAIAQAYRSGTLLTGGGGGASAKSAILSQPNKTLTGTALVFAAGDVVKDEIGMTLDPGGAIYLPKGYYSASLFVNPLGFPTDMGAPGDEWNLAVYATQIGGYHNGAAVPPNPNQGPMLYQAISGSAASIGDQALQSGFLFESGDQDIHSLLGTVPVGSFATLALEMSATDVTTGAGLWSGTPGYTESFAVQVLLQLQQLAKA